jgi:RND family efflux transporter MFP subunit
MITIRQTSVAASALLLLSACHPGGEENPEEIAAQRSRALATRDVRLVQPEVREEYPTLELVGEIRAFDTVAISPEVAGKVDRVLVEVGDRVREGQPLAEIDRSTYTLYLEQAAARHAAAVADLALASKELERKRDLVSDNTIPQAAFDQAKAAFDLATANVAAAEAAHNLAERNYERSMIRAPAGGAITRRTGVAGQYADVGQHLFELAIGEKVKVAAEVPATWAPRLAGLEGFQFRAAQEKDLRTARIYAIDPAVERASRSFEVIGIAPNTDGDLRPGMFANIVLQAPQPVRSLWLPASAIAAGDLPKVMLAVDGEVVERDVQVGRREGGAVELVAGLEAGEAVIADVAGLGRGLPVEVVDGRPS